jgi:hypothetical protein
VISLARFFVLESKIDELMTGASDVSSSKSVVFQFPMIFTLSSSMSLSAPP